MKRTTHYTALALLAAVGTTALAPAAVLADNDSARQSNKNLMRNLAIGGAAIAGLGLLQHNNGAGPAWARRARPWPGASTSRPATTNRWTRAATTLDITTGTGTAATTSTTVASGRYGDSNGYQGNSRHYQSYGNAYGWGQQPW